jgi:hypothetical protein
MCVINTACIAPDTDVILHICTKMKIVNNNVFCWPVASCAAPLVYNKIYRVKDSRPGRSDAGGVRNMHISTYKDNNILNLLESV